MKTLEQQLANLLMDRQYEKFRADKHKWSGIFDRGIDHQYLDELDRKIAIVKYILVSPLYKALEGLSDE